MENYNLEDHLEITRETFKLLTEVQRLFTEKEHDENTCQCDYFSRMKSHLVDKL